MRIDVAPSAAAPSAALSPAAYLAVRRRRRHPLSPGAARLIAVAVIWSVPLAVMALFAWIVTDIVAHGASHLSWDFLTTAPRRSGRAGGIAPILVSTALITLVCMSVAVPIGLGSALLLAEYVPPQSRAGRWIRGSLNVLAGLPSIVFGLFGNAFFCVTLGFGFSILAGGLTLACMVLPIFIRASEECLRGVPDTYRRAAAALGVGKARAVASVVIPIALPGLIAAFLLGLGRATAETAALVFTSGYVDRMPSSLLDSGRALSVHIFDLSMNISGGDASAYASALVLIGFLLTITSALTVLGWWSSLRRGIGR